MDTRRRRSGDRGAAAVEAALVMPVLLLIVFGLIDFGRMLNAQIIVNHTASQAARAASLGYDPASAGTAASGLAGSPATIDASGCVVGGAAEENLTATATVTYQFSFITPFALLAELTTGPIELTGRGVMPCRG